MPKPKGKYDKDTAQAIRDVDSNYAGFRYGMNEARKLGGMQFGSKDPEGASAYYEAGGNSGLKMTEAKDRLRKLNPDLTEKGVSDTLEHAVPPQYKKGGKVRKTGMAKVHKGERVLTVKQAKKYGKLKKSSGSVKKVSLKK